MQQVRHFLARLSLKTTMGWLRLVGSLKLQVSFAKAPYKRDDILQKRLIILRSLLIVATPQYLTMGWLRLVGSIKFQVSFAEYSLFCRALLHKRRTILSVLLTVATLQYLTTIHLSRLPSDYCLSFSRKTLSQDQYLTTVSLFRNTLTRSTCDTLIIRHVTHTRIEIYVM